jgi:hypothetical protein
MASNASMVTKRTYRSKGPKMGDPIVTAPRARHTYNKFSNFIQGYGTTDVRVGRGGGPSAVPSQMSVANRRSYLVGQGGWTPYTKGGKNPILKG